MSDYVNLPKEQVEQQAHLLALSLGLNDQNSYTSATLAASYTTALQIDSLIRSVLDRGRATADAIFAVFCALYLDKLFAAYKATPIENIATPYTMMMSAVVSKGHFVRFTRTPQGRELFYIQMQRFAGPKIPLSSKDVHNMAQLFNFFVVYTYYDQDRVPPAMTHTEKQVMLDKAAACQRHCNRLYKQGDAVAGDALLVLSETIAFLNGETSPERMLGTYGMTMPLLVCGDLNSRCWATGTKAPLHCSKCESVRYCSQLHQQSHWTLEHRTQCVKPVWL